MGFAGTAAVAGRVEIVEAQHHSPPLSLVCNQL